MQLNLYVSKEKAGLVRRLEEAAKRRGRPKSELVMEALEAYLGRGERPTFEPAAIGIGAMPARGAIYDEWLREKYSSIRTS